MNFDKLAYYDFSMDILVLTYYKPEKIEVITNCNRLIGYLE